MVMDESARDMDRDEREAAHKALRRAVAVAGSQTAFAEIVGTTQQSISNWMRDRWPLAVRFVLDAEIGTGVSRHDLRPDIYPREGSSNGSPDTLHPSDIAPRPATGSCDRRDVLQPGELAA